MNRASSRFQSRSVGATQKAMQSVIRYCKSSSPSKISHHAANPYAILYLSRELSKHGSPVLVATTRDPICEDGGDSSRDAEAKKPHSAYSSPYFALPSHCLALVNKLSQSRVILAGRCPGLSTCIIWQQGLKAFGLSSCTSWDPCLPAYSRGCMTALSITRYLLLKEKSRTTQRFSLPIHLGEPWQGDPVDRVNARYQSQQQHDGRTAAS